MKGKFFSVVVFLLICISCIHSQSLAVFGSAGTTGYAMGVKSPAGLSARLGMFYEGRVLLTGNARYDSYRHDITDDPQATRLLGFSVGAGGRPDEHFFVTANAGYSSLLNGSDGEFHMSVNGHFNYEISRRLEFYGGVELGRTARYTFLTATIGVLFVIKRPPDKPKTFF